MILLGRIALAVISGALVYASFEPLGFWIAGIAGIALFYAALMPWGEHRPTGGSGALVGFVHGLSSYLLLLPWIGEYVGNLPYIALAVACALYAIATGVFGVLLARQHWGFLAFPLVYVAVEYGRSSFPFGGFSWVRLAWGQINGPLASLAAWGGPALVTFAAAVVGCAIVGMFRWWKPALVALLVPLVAGVVANVGVNNPEHTTGEVTASAVQGNVPRMGLDFNAQRRAVLANHAQETYKLAQSGANPEIVIWPENSSDVNPFTDPQARSLIDGAVEAVNAPTLVGTITRDEVGARNTMVVFDPEDGPGDYHHKKFLQPFGETMPMRDFFALFSPYVDDAGDFKPGAGNGVVRMGDILMGVATCYEVAFDPAYRQAVLSGAQILTTPTNNATFGFTNMTYQQLAMSRMRAIELDRALVVSATSGVSAMVHPDGSVSQETGIFEAATLTETLPLRDSLTFAARFGQYVQALLVIAGVFLMIAAVALRGRR